MNIILNWLSTADAWRQIITMVFFVGFIAIVVWAWRKSNQPYWLMVSEQILHDDKDIHQ